MSLNGLGVYYMMSVFVDVLVRVGGGVNFQHS